MEPRAPFLIACALLAGTALGGRQEQAKTSKQTLYYIPHTHWEGAVFFTREEYLQMGLSNIISALRLLEKYPDYKFTLDQVAYFKPFLERYPELGPAFRKFVKEGRLELVGGMDVMPDDVKPGGELFVRQIQYGKKFVHDELGVDVDTAWLLDTFGHHPQIPQLLKLGGFKSFWFCRGQYGDNTPSEFLWKGIDGSTIPTFWLPGFYGLFYGPPKEPGLFDKFFEQRFHSLDSHTHFPERVGLAGVDVSEPEDYVTPLIRQYNSKPDAPFTIRYSVPSEFADLVAKRPNEPVLTGDFNPIFQGTYSSRIELKQATRDIEQRLLTAEKLSAITSWLGMPVDEQALWQAWEPVLFNQTHDLASGVMADHVYTDTVRGYDFSKRLAEEIIAKRWQAIASRIDTLGPGTPVIVFNPLGSTRRSEVVEVDLGFGESQANDLLVLGPNGEVVPVQLVMAERYNDGLFRRVKVAFVAKDVPGLGYSVYHIVGKRSNPGLMEMTPKPVGSIENEQYKVDLDPKTGAVVRVFDKLNQTDCLSGPANVVARQTDKGDLWELYHTLDGASYVPGTDKQPVPNATTALLSTEGGEKAGTAVNGPVFSEFTVAHKMGSGAFSTKIRLEAGNRRIEFHTELVNNEKQVRYQVLFPSAIRNGKYRQEIPFGSVERPVGVEYPAQNWADYSDGQHGVALLNMGMPGNLVSENGTLMLSLLRSQTLGDYNEGHTSESGYELGTPREFHYALLPHFGDWRSGDVTREAQELNCPLMVFKEPIHGGTLPKKWTGIEISRPDVVLTSYEPGPDGAAFLRVYEASGQQRTKVQITLPANVRSASETNLLGAPGVKLPIERTAVFIDLHPFEIKTIKLKLAPGRKH